MTSTRRSGAALLLRSALPALLVAGAVACGAAAGQGAGEPPSPDAAPAPGETAETLPAEPGGQAGVRPGAEGEVPTAVGRRAPGGVLLDTVRAGRFDDGRMWTFEYPPIEWLDEAYGFRPDTSWFRSARLGALRIPGCSASFVSAHGLVMTNHHCARESVTGVREEGENLLDEGFYARSVEEERPVEEFH
ncbi:MAG TPA: S46 family peptidase, partial [Longimicrobiales bacterium]|nr:S46 family peptidase [Longimicrobiales bacterium]